MEAEEEEKEKEGKKGEGEKEMYGLQWLNGNKDGEIHRGLVGHASAMMSCKGNLGAWEEWKRVFWGGLSKLTWLHLGQSLLSKEAKCIRTPADQSRLSPGICVPPRLDLPQCVTMINS